MRNQLVTIETALLCKELNFGYEVDYSTVISLTIEEQLVYKTYLPSKLSVAPNADVIPRPSQSLVAKWLRQEYDMHIVLDLIVDEPNYYGYRIRTKPDYVSRIGGIGSTYELALEGALQTALNFIKANELRRTD